MNEHARRRFLQQAIDLAIEGVRSDRGGPFGAVLARDGKVVASGCNQVTSTNDPTAHAEIVAIRAACAELGTNELRGCEIFASCEPCPMCLAAIYWARIERVTFACSRDDAARAGFDDAFVYEELARNSSERRLPSQSMMREEGLAAFHVWRAKPDRKQY